MNNDHSDLRKLIVPLEDESQEDRMERTFQILADARAKQLAVPRSNTFKRKQVIDAFQDAFELIGGVTRLALWANEHPTEFYKLYSKLLGNQVQVDLGNDGVLKIVHSLAPGPLDLPKGEVIDGEFETKA